MTSDTERTDSEPMNPKGRGELKRMSFGDHLDELRRRLLWCAGTLFVAVMVMFPFKDSVTSIYTAPYRFMWEQAYQDFLKGIEQEFAEGVGPADPQTRYEAATFLTDQVVKDVLAGGYQDPVALRDRGGFQTPYPARPSPQWDAFASSFSDYASKLRADKDGIKRLIWHRERSAEILSGDYKYKEMIQLEGGFLLKYSLTAMGGLEDFWTFMAAALLFSCIIASPVLLWHIWAFIAAGLYKTERAVVHRALPFALALLVAGVAFGFFVMVPYGLYFLTRLMEWTQVAPMFTVALYFKFFLTLTVALGLVFQLPVLMLALQRVGILKFETLVKHWRWVILCMFLISALLTPPDPVTQLMMVTPMITLFLLGLGMMWRADRKTKRLKPEEDPTESPA